MINMFMNLNQKFSLKKIARTAAVGVASLAMVIPLTLGGFNAGVNVHAESLTEMSKEASNYDAHDKQYQSEERADAQAYDRGLIHDMKTGDLAAVQDALDGQIEGTNAEKSVVMSQAHKVEKKAKTNGAWYNPTSEPSKYYANGKHGYGKGVHHAKKSVTHRHARKSVSSKKAKVNHLRKEYKKTTSKHRRKTINQMIKEINRNIRHISGHHSHRR